MTKIQIYLGNLYCYKAVHSFLLKLKVIDLSRDDRQNQQK